MDVAAQIINSVRGITLTQSEADAIKNHIDQCVHPGMVREEAIKNASYHGELATASYRAAAFFEAHPAFEEFIRLVRCGAIQL